jgi:stage II sporulation protein AA (anti-sigma F factor antagonist)
VEIQCQKSNDGKNLLFKISGDCDMYSTRDFYTGIAGKLDEYCSKSGGCNKVVLDFSGVSYLDSSGVGVIIKIMKIAKEKQITLRFRGISGSPRKVLAMSNILLLIVEEP